MSDLKTMFRAYRQMLNGPITEGPVLVQTELKLPSQKQYKDLANLAMSIEAIRGVLFVLEQQIETETPRAKAKLERHKAKYKREPQLAKQDPHNYVTQNRLKNLVARQKSNELLLSCLEDAYKELARKPYKPRSDANACVQPDKRRNRRF